MKFSFISLFDDIIKNYFKHSILSKAIKNNLIEIETLNLRDFSQNKHNTVDDTVYGGGNGQLLNVEPLVKSLEKLKNSHIIFLTPAGKTFTQKDAKRLSKKSHITFVCGRYEGFDERAIELMANEVLSIGDYVLTGGELASLSMCDAISRNISEVLSNKALEEESFNEDILEYPSFTKPQVFNEVKIPSILSSGNHKKIEEYRHKVAILKTKYHRVDLYSDYRLRKTDYRKKL